jgi:hypothetical protein
LALSTNALFAHQKSRPDPVKTVISGKKANEIMNKLLGMAQPECCAGA